MFIWYWDDELIAATISWTRLCEIYRRSHISLPAFEKSQRALSFGGAELGLRVPAPVFGHPAQGLPD